MKLLFRAVFLLVAAFFLPAVASAAMQDGYFPKNSYEARFCAGLKAHYRQVNAMRVDCTDGAHAIVVEYQDYWPEAVGQALSYAAETGLKPGIIMVCRNDQMHCDLASAHIRQAFAHVDLPLTLWRCLPIDATLADCDVAECKGETCN